MTPGKSVKFFGTAALAMLLAAPVLAREWQRHPGASTRVTQPHTRTAERQRTENGRTRSDTWIRTDGKTASVDSGRTRTGDGFTRATKITNPQGETATRDLTVSRDTEARTVTRESNYTTFDGRDGSKSDVIQRTEDGFSRDLTRTLANGETHTRSVDVSCEKSVGKCVKQVEVDQQPSGE
jgi:hypothetical protein